MRAAAGASVAQHFTQLAEFGRYSIRRRRRSQETSELPPAISLHEINTRRVPVSGSIHAIQGFGQIRAQFVSFVQRRARPKKDRVRHAIMRIAFSMFP